MNINVKKLNEEAVLPFRATPGSAGADLHACIEEEILLMPQERRLIPSGIAIEIPEGYGGFVFPRSSVSSLYGVTLANCVGVIDSDYRGEIKTALTNHSTEPYLIKNGDRIAQLVIIPIETAQYNLVEELPQTQRGEGGYGSTGR